MYIPHKHEIPVYEKTLITMEEAAAIFNIGVHKIRQLTGTRKCKFVTYFGSQRLIKRQQFEEFLNNQYSI